MSMWSKMLWLTDDYDSGLGHWEYWTSGSKSIIFPYNNKIRTVYYPDSLVYSTIIRVNYNNTEYIGLVLLGPEFSASRDRNWGDIVFYGTVNIGDYYSAYTVHLFNLNDYLPNNNNYNTEYVYTKEQVETVFIQDYFNSIMSAKIPTIYKSGSSVRFRYISDIMTKDDNGNVNNTYSVIRKIVGIWLIINKHKRTTTEYITINRNADRIVTILTEYKDKYKWFDSGISAITFSGDLNNLITIIGDYPGGGDISVTFGDYAKENNFTYQQIKNISVKPQHKITLSYDSDKNDFVFLYEDVSDWESEGDGIDVYMGIKVINDINNFKTIKSSDLFMILQKFVPYDIFWDDTNINHEPNYILPYFGTYMNTLPPKIGTETNNLLSNVNYTPRTDNPRMFDYTGDDHIKIKVNWCPFNFIYDTSMVDFFYQTNNFIDTVDSTLKEKLKLSQSLREYYNTNIKTIDEIYNADVFKEIYSFAQYNKGIWIRYEYWHVLEYTEINGVINITNSGESVFGTYVFPSGKNIFQSDFPYTYLYVTQPDGFAPSKSMRFVNSYVPEYGYTLAAGSGYEINEFDIYDEGKSGIVYRFQFINENGNNSTYVNDIYDYDDGGNFYWYGIGGCPIGYYHNKERVSTYKRKETVGIEILYSNFGNDRLLTDPTPTIY